jgi:hypothetical protein
MHNYRLNGMFDRERIPLSGDAESSRKIAHIEPNSSESAKRWMIYAELDALAKNASMTAGVTSS